mgnify:CR=1 FL=1
MATAPVARVRTVDWLDKMLNGGLPKGTWTVITGGPGVGKSVLTILIAGGNLKTMPIIYVTTESSFRDVVRQAGLFGLDLGNAVSLHDILTGKANAGESNMIVIDLFSLYRQYRELIRGEGGRKPSRALSIEVLKSAVSRALEELGLLEGNGRITGEVLLIVDSMTAFWADKPALARALSYGLRQSLYGPNLTVIMTSQYAPTTAMSFGFGLEHVADGIIHMWMDDVEAVKEVRRWLIIKKMRLTNHYSKAVRFSITEKGIIPLEPSLGEVNQGP